MAALPNSTVTLSEKQWVVFVIHQPVQRLALGRVAVDAHDGQLVIRTADDQVQVVANQDCRLLPHRLLSHAQHHVGLPAAADDIDEMLKHAMNAGTFVLSAAAPGTFGGSAVMSGLATIGGSAVGGIAVVAGAPAALGAKALNDICDNVENDNVTRVATRVGTTTGVVVGSSGAVAAVASSGSVAGLSASGITSGLAALGGGSISAGGAGMVGGLFVCSGIGIVAVGIIGGLTWLCAHESRQQKIEREYAAFINHWRAQGYQGPL